MTPIEYLLIFLMSIALFIKIKEIVSILKIRKKNKEIILELERRKKQAQF